MQCVLVILVFTAIPKAGQARGITQEPQVIELNLKEVSLKNALKEIEKQTSYHFVVNDSRLKSNKRMVSLTIKSENIEEVLQQLLSGTNITYTIKKKQITLIPPDGSSQTSPVTLLSEESSSLAALNVSTYYQRNTVQVVAITGVVTEENGAPLPGVNVVIKGTTIGTVTDGAGKFSLNVDSPDAVLVFSFIGYVMQEIPLGGQTVINVKLAPDTKTLSEVVVVGYGRRRRLM
jgi:hypothetical protein